MTDPITNKQTSWKELFFKSLPLASIMSGLLSVVFVAVVIGLTQMYGERVRNSLDLASSRDVTEITEALAEIHDQLTLLKRQVAIAARPDQIGIYISEPTPTEGFCVAGQPCKFSLLVERDPRAISCKLIPGSTKIVITVDNVEYTAPVIMPRGQNVATRPTGVEPSFDIPSSIPKGLAIGQIVTEYTDCDWQVKGVPPTVSESQFFEFEIR